VSTRNSLRSQTHRLVEPVGLKFLTTIESHANQTMPAAIMAANGDQPARSASRISQVRGGRCPITYFGEGTLGQLREAAIDNACDVLVLFDMSESPDRGARSLSCEFVDVVRNKSLLNLPRVHWLVRSGSVQELERNEDYREAKWLLEDLLEEQLAFGDWPESLKARHAADRVTGLASVKGLHPLSAVAEMCLYRDKQLLDNRQLLEGFRGLLGGEAGEILMLGDERSRAKLFRRWLPTEMSVSGSTKSLTNVARQTGD
jgi:hypothetical protein